jgi:hypothetical protein
VLLLERAGQILRQDPGAAREFSGCGQVSIMELRRLANEGAGAGHGVGLSRAQRAAIQLAKDGVGLAQIGLVARFELFPLVSSK